MLACTNAMAAEFANDRRRGAAVSLMAAGYPVGAITGGSMATSLLESGSWRDVFTFGAIATAAFLPIVLILVPETVASIMQQRPADILDRVNQALRRIGKATIDALPDSSDQAHAKVAWATLFAPELRRVTILLTFTYFAHILTFYFIIKWVPKIVADLGFSPASAGGVLVWANIGGLIGALLFSALTMKAALRPLLAAAMFASALAVVWFGRGQPDLAGLSQAAAVAGFFINAGIVGFYALAAASFPAALRAGGTGFAIGVGRSGAALAPIFAGILFAGGFGLQAVAAIMALGSLFAAFAVLAMPKCNAPTHETAVPLGRL
jgi:predicted MFS family arabinose efflux permease